jgi:hypothetical protein
MGTFMGMEEMWEEYCGQFAWECYGLTAETLTAECCASHSVSRERSPDWGVQSGLIGENGVDYGPGWVLPDWLLEISRA